MKSCDLSDIELLLLLLLELTGKKEEKQALSSVVCSEGKLNDGRSILPIVGLKKTSIVRPKRQKDLQRSYDTVDIPSFGLFTY